MKRETVKRVLALLICVLMTVSLLPAVAMAEEVTEDVIDDSTIEAYTSYETERTPASAGSRLQTKSPTRISRSYPATPTP